MARLITFAGLQAAALAACDGDTDGSDPRGAACSSDRECGELACVADLEADAEDLAPLALACEAALGSHEPGEACDEAADCGSGICLLGGACARPCAEPEDCGERERCQAAFARVANGALQSLSACVNAVDLPEGTTAEPLDGPDRLGPEASRIELDAVPDDGVTLYVLEALPNGWPDGVRCRAPLCARALRTRDAMPIDLFDSALDYGRAPAPRNPVATGDHVYPTVVMLPIGAASALSPAGYTLEVSAEKPVSLQGMRLSGSGGGQRLDLNVFYVGALDWAPQGDRGPPLLADALAVVDEIFAQADIFVGDVRQIEVAGELPERGTAFPDGDAAQGFARLQVRRGVYMELPALFRLSAGAGNSAVNLFFVKDIDPRGATGELEAEAGGIPGPLGMHGTSGSGIAIATDMMAGNPEQLGRTLAHELGHYLGLFHTSEADGTVLDPLSDTPECRAERDLAGDGLSIDDCEGAGADNLMFWAKTSGRVLTEQQRAVLRRALILQ